MTAPALPVLSKGTSLQAYVSAAYVSVSAVISLDLPQQEQEHFEADYLANPSPGIPYLPTGRTEGGSCSGELWLDPSLTVAGQTALATLLATPTSTALSSAGQPGIADWAVIFRHGIQ